MLTSTRSSVNHMWLRETRYSALCAVGVASIPGEVPFPANHNGEDKYSGLLGNGSGLYESAVIAQIG